MSKHKDLDITQDILDLITKDISAHAEEYDGIVTPYKVNIHTANNEVIREALELGFRELIKRRCK